MEQGDYNSINTCADLWISEKERRNQELHTWLDEFLESEEFAHYLYQKRRCLEKSTQYSEQIPETVEAVKPAKNLFLLYKKLQKALEKKNVKNTYHNQIVGIDIIRKKMFAQKHLHRSQRGLKEHKLKAERAEVLRLLREDYNIVLNIPLNRKIVEKVTATTRKQLEFSERKRKNYIRIVNKILFDARRQMEIQRAQNKTYDYKVKSNERFVEGLEITGTRIKLQSHEVQQIEVAVVEEEIEKDVKPTEVVKDIVDSKKSKSTLSTKGKTNKKDKSKKDEKDKKSKKDEKAKKGKGKKALKEIPDLVIPTGAAVNTRDKIGDPQHFANLIKDFDQLKTFLNDKASYAIENLFEDNVFYKKDQQMFFKPNKIIFKDFVNDETYKKRIFIQNGATSSRKIRYERTIWNAEIDDELLLEFDPISTQLITPGLGFSFLLRFNPRTLERIAEAKVIFLTYSSKFSRYKQIALEVMCVPHCANVVSEPTTITFDEMFIWRGQKTIKERTNYKILKIKNTGVKDCRVVISKVFSPINIEQHWRNIISIMDIQDDEPPITGADQTAEREEFPRNLIVECVENVFNTFYFERAVINIRGQSTTAIKVWFRNMAHVGYHVETYKFSVYERFPDKKLYCIGTKDLIVSGCLNGHFINIDPHILDFGVCLHGSIYQLILHLHNPTNSPHKVRIRFTSTMKEYLKCTPPDVTLQPKHQHKVTIKFSPRKDIIQSNSKYYEPEYQILEFPIHVCVHSCGYEDTPVIHLDAFAAISESSGLWLNPVGTAHKSVVDKEFLFDLGYCNTTETLWCDLQLCSRSIAPQEYAFLDLPPYITIMPNFGFGRIRPLGRKYLRIFYSPSARDIWPSFGEQMVRISVTTVKELGALKKQIDLKKVNTELKKLENIIDTPVSPHENNLIYDMHVLLSQIKNIQPDESIELSGEDVISNVAKSTDEVVLDVVHYDSYKNKEVVIQSHDEYLMEEEESNPQKNSLWLRSVVFQALSEFNYQHVIFPDTACGSYSVMNVKLKAFTHVWKNKKKKVEVQHRASFEIVGNCEQIRIEPSIGMIQPGQTVNLYVVARPETPQKIVEEKARVLRALEMVEAKRTEHRLKWEKQQEALRAKNAQKSKGTKDSKGKTGSDSKKGQKSKTETPELVEYVEPEIIIDKGSIIIGYLDLYQAEMCVWRGLEPYFITAKFCCTISYKGDKIERAEDVLFLEAKCRVVHPDYVHDLKLQELDFGNVIIGANAKKVIKFQNIQENAIQPTLSTLCPTGPFSTLQAVGSVPSEYFFMVPVNFAPKEEGENCEYLEIISGPTVCPIMLKGIGVALNIEFKPNFLVCRVVALKNKCTNCTFEIFNKSTAPLPLLLTKICELEGDMLTKPTPPTDQNTTDKKGKKDAKNGGKEKPPPKFSPEFTENEIYSLQTSFKKRPSESLTFFQALGNGATSDEFIAAAQGKQVITIQFGYPPPSSAGKDKSKKGSSKDKSSKGSNSSASGKKGKYYIAKYNISVGAKTFLKDFIIVATFG